MSNFKESEILSKASKIIEESGAITTTDLIYELEREMKPDGQDLLINKSRSDTKFSQKVRNMISHRKANRLLDFCTYKRVGNNGLLISKTIDETLPDHAREEKGSKRHERRRKFSSRKVDFDEINKRNKEIGDMGEKFVLNYERTRLSPLLASKVRHVSREDGDGAGYDILSYTEDNNVRFLEVKTTTGGKETPFYLSENERLFLETNVDEVEIVRVYNFNVEKQTGEIERISGKNFLKNFSLEPIYYRATINTL